MSAQSLTPVLSEIINAVCREFGVSKARILGPQRARSIARPRQVIMYLSALYTGQSLPQIGRQLRRDHTTILHGRKTITNLLTYTPELNARVEKIKFRLKQRKVLQVGEEGYQVRRYWDDPNYRDYADEGQAMREIWR